MNTLSKWIMDVMSLIKSEVFLCQWELAQHRYSNVAKYISYPKETYVGIPADKAPYSVPFVCKKSLEDTKV